MIEGINKWRPYHGKQKDDGHRYVAVLILKEQVETT